MDYFGKNLKEHLMQDQKRLILVLNYLESEILISKYQDLKCIIHQCQFLLKENELYQTTLNCNYSKYESEINNLIFNNPTVFNIIKTNNRRNLCQKQD